MPRFPSNIRAISLDLDDTLWPVGPTIVRAEQRAQAALTEHAPQVAAAWNIDRLRALRAKILDEQQHLRHDLLQIRRLALQHAFADCGLSLHSFPTRRSSDHRKSVV